MTSSFPYLSLLILLPLCGAMLCLLLRRSDTLAWLVAITVATIAVLVVASVGLDRGARWGRTSRSGTV